MELLGDTLGHPVAQARIIVEKKRHGDCDLLHELGVKNTEHVRVVIVGQKLREREPRFCWRRSPLSHNGEVGHGDVPFALCQNSLTRKIGNCHEVVTRPQLLVQEVEASVFVISEECH